MKWNKKTALGSFAVLVIGVISVLLSREREPSYQGRLLTSWLRIYRHSDKDESELAGFAIQRIGTNGLPTLLHLAQAKDSKRSLAFVTFANQYSFGIFHIQSAFEKRQFAELGFRMLKADAKDAVPALTEMLHDPETRDTALLCLSWIGPDAESAIPEIIIYGCDKGKKPTDSAIFSLGSIQRRPELSLPVLLSSLNQHAQASDAGGVYLDLYWIGKFGYAAKSAVPQVKALLHHSDKAIQSIARNTLPEIDEDAARRKFYPARVTEENQEDAQ